MAKGIRSYGPGKFDDIIDSYAHEVALDGVDEEISIGEGNGWYGLVRNNAAFCDNVEKAAVENRDELTPEETALLERSEALILFERSDGIVEVTWFNDAKEADEEWARLEEELEDDEEDDEEGDDEDSEDGDDAFSDEEMLEGYVISDSRGGGYEVAHSHKHVGHYDDMGEAIEEINARMELEKFWPNIYYVNDHGNVDLLDADGKIIESRV